MTEKEAKTLPLWEVWGQLEGDLETSSVFSELVADKLGFTESIQMLRGVLLERCKKVGIRQNTTGGTRFSIVDGSIHVDNWGATIRHDTPETARNMSAAYAFMAWELEQRQKEAPN